MHTIGKRCIMEANLEDRGKGESSMTLEELEKQTTEKIIKVECETDRGYRFDIEDVILISVEEYYQAKGDEIAEKLDTEDKQTICQYIYDNFYELAEPLKPEEALDMIGSDEETFLDNWDRKQDAIALERHLKGNG